MHNKLNRIVSMILVVFTILTPLLFTASVSIHAESETETQKELTAYYNLFASEIIDSGGTSSSLNNTAEIELSIESDSSGLFCGNGIVLENNSALFAINFEGMFMNTTVTTKSVGINTDRVTTLYGEATGFVSDSEDPVVLTLYHIPQTDYTFVFLAVGANSETKTEDTYVFGTVFGEIDEMTQEVISSRGLDIESMVSDDLVNLQDVDVISSEVIESGEPAKASTKAVWRNSAIVTWGGYPIVSTSIYTQTKVDERVFCDAYVKINASEANLRKWFTARYGLWPMWIDSGTCSIYAPRGYAASYGVDFMKAYPKSQSTNISFEFPSWILPHPYGMVLDIINIAFSMSFARIKQNIYEYAGSYSDNRCDWAHNYARDIGFENHPASSKKGYAGKVVYTFMGEQNQFTLAASGSVHYHYTKRLQHATIIGGGTFQSAETYCSIKVAKK